MVSRYVPEAGDVIWIDLNPTMGHEQAGRRPALVLSPAYYNDKTSLAVACPMSTKVKGYPFEVPMPDGAVILSDQLKSIDWRFRKAKFKEKAPREIVERVRAIVGRLLQT